MAGLNGTSVITAALYSLTVWRNCSGVHASSFVGQLLEGVGAHLGHALDAVLVAQQVERLGVENLPGELLRLREITAPYLA